MTTQFQDSFSEEVWETTYKDHNDKTVDDTFRRVATAIASVEKTEELRKYWSEKFFEMLTDFKVVVGGRITSNAGTEWGGTTLMNCFVGPRVKHDVDSINGIVKALSDQINTLKSEGGWGENFSYIRPRGAFIHGIGVETPGAVKYMEGFDKWSDIITSGSGKKSTHKKAKGKIRKGAMMGVLDVWHPDIIEFITAKQQPGRLSKFNVSVNVSDEFMSRLLKIKAHEQYLASLIPSKSGMEPVDAEITTIQILIEEADVWKLIFPETTFEKYKDEWDGNIVAWKAKGYPVKVYNTISVKWLWNLIMESTYNRAEPGVLFLDRANKLNPFYYGETIFATNPCGEQTLSPGNVCCLGTVNLTQFVSGKSFDYDKLTDHVKMLVRFLDNVDEYSIAPLPEYIDSMRNKRRIGCGVMGWGSALMMMKVRFASDEALKIQQELMQCYAKAAYEASIDLAVEKGMFKYCNPENHAKGQFINSIGLSDEYLARLRATGIRNASLMSQQPNGNGSIYANVVTGGIEPAFMPEYIRTVIIKSTPDEIAAVTPKWYEGEWAETEVFKFAKEGDEEILRGVFNGVTYKIDKNRGLTKEVLCEDYGVRWLKARGEWDVNADWAVTTTQLGVNDHINDLNGFARYTDSACSKTVNIPNDYPFEEFKNLYIDAYKTGYIKGLTTYRSGIMASVLSAKDEKNADSSDEEIILDDIKLPDSLPATMKRLRAEGKKWYVTMIMNEEQTRPIALFVQTNHHEKNVTTSNAIDILLKLARDKGIPEQFIKEIEEKISGDNNASKIARAISLNLRHGVMIKNVVKALDTMEDVYVGSFLFVIRKYLSTFIRDGETVDGAKCEECGGKVVYQEGCFKCLNCGSSKCG
jgi:ribonucleoside-diphosphate reductase alpha chain